ncbi:MAG: fumarate hydratase [Promethearchaeati archaeon SRVP18_Atabeyarchaeia-1]
MEFPKVIENMGFQLISFAVTDLPQDVRNRLRKAYQDEKSEIGRTQLETILDNIELADKLKLPMCQDTGIISFYVKVGSRFPAIGMIEDSLTEALRRATTEIPLRPNVVHPITRANSGDNTGLRVPHIEWEIDKTSDDLIVTVFPKGAGSENMCTFKMLKPGEGVQGVKKFVIDSVAEAGGQPCPPIIVGVGIGGTADVVMGLAKRALTNPLDEDNPDSEIASLEKELYELINETGIGPQGLGGKYTALSVKILLSSCHTASLPVACAIQCWAARKSTARLDKNGSVTYLTHSLWR